MEYKDPRATTALPPQSEEQAATNEAINVSKNQEPAKKFLIMVVDDAADNVAILSLDLQQQGYRVVTATDGEEAISVAFSTLPDLILMDISMPRLDGLKLSAMCR